MPGSVEVSLTLIPTLSRNNEMRNAGGRRVKGDGENRILQVRNRVGKSMAISLFLALPEIRAVDAMPCL